MVTLKFLGLILPLSFVAIVEQSLLTSAVLICFYRYALMAPFWGRHGCMSLYIYDCPGGLSFCYFCSRLQFARTVDRSRGTSPGLNWICKEMHSWLHLGRAAVACRCTYFLVLCTLATLVHA